MRNTINKPIPLSGTSLGKGRNSAFTLVELIIVITILAILATIGFMSYQSYTVDARDTNRITSLKTMSDGLQIYQAKKSTLPDPDPQTVSIMSGGILISTQGYAGASVLQTLRASDIKDPSDKSYYTYIVNSDKTKYQLLGMLEKDTNLVALNQGFINETYARDYTSKYAYTTGNKVGVFFSGTTNIPLQETMSGNLVLTDITNATKVFKVMFTNTSSTGVIGSSLPGIIEAETDITAVASNDEEVIPLNSCSSIQPVCSPTGCTLIIGTPTSVDQAWIKDASNCGFTCNANYSGTNCEIYTPPFVCETSTVIAGGYTYNTKLLAGKCRTVGSIKHGTKLAAGSTMPSDINTIEKWCYSNTDTNCTNDGGLYTWYEAMGLTSLQDTIQVEDTTKSVCGQLGAGWHLPSNTDWTNLLAVPSTGWTGNKLSGLISSIPGRRITNGSFDSIAINGFWWSSTRTSSSNAYLRYLYFGNSTVTSNNYDKLFGFSVLCLKN